MKHHIPFLHKLTLLSIVIFTFILYLGLGRDYLFEWDEAIYGQLGVEARSDHNFLTSHWNRELWLEKPPAITWVTALGQSLVSSPELGSRLLMPLFAAATLYAIYQIGVYFGGTLLGASSVAILGYFNLFLSRARVVNTDGMLLAAIAWLVWLLLKGSSPWKVGLVAALAVFAKGPAGVLALLIATPILLKKPRKYLYNAALSFLIIVLPWHLYQLAVNGSAFYTPYLLEQVFRRATVPIEFHLESRYFYFISLYKDLGLGVLLVAALGFLFSLKYTWLFSIWALLPLFIFTLAKTRLSWYILPSYPGIALLVGSTLNAFVKEKKSKTVVTILVVGMLAQLLYHTYSYVNPARTASPLPDHIKIAKLLASYPEPSLAFLVSSSERTAEAILPAEQTISSSFRYGGAPSVVFYSGKKVYYYYNYDRFQEDLNSGRVKLAIVTRDDIGKIPSNWVMVGETDSYLAYSEGAVYAYR